MTMAASILWIIILFAVYYDVMIISWIEITLSILTVLCALVTLFWLTPVNIKLLAITSNVY